MWCLSWVNLSLHYLSQEAYCWSHCATHCVLSFTSNYCCQFLASELLFSVCKDWQICSCFERWPQGVWSWCVSGWCSLLQLWHMYIVDTVTYSLVVCWLWWCSISCWWNKKLYNTPMSLHAWPNNSFFHHGNCILPSIQFNSSGFYLYSASNKGNDHKAALQKSK